MSDLDNLVGRWAALDESRQEIESEQRAIKLRIASELQHGKYALGGLVVTVSAPSRKFNLETARGFLTPEQIELATISTLDVAKVKSFLPSVLLDQAMDPGTGNDVVRIA